MACRRCDTKPLYVSSIPAGSTITYRFLCGFICVSLCQSVKIIPTNMYIASARAQFKINTHRCWNWHLCIPDGLSVVQCSHGHVIGVAFFWRDFSGVKRTCWTTGSWRSCLSLEVADQRKHQSSATLAFLWGIHRWPVNSPHKWPITRKMLPFDDVILYGHNNHYDQTMRLLRLCYS